MLTTTTAQTTTTVRRIIKEPTEHPIVPCPIFFYDVLGQGLEVICRHPSHDNEDNNIKDSVTNG